MNKYKNNDSQGGETINGGEGSTGNPPEVPSLWGEPQILPASIAHVIPSSKAGNNLGLIFEDLRIALNSDDLPLSRTVIANLNAPLTPDEDKQFLGYLISIEGQIIKDKAAKVALLVDVAGGTKVIEFVYNEERGLIGESGLFGEELFAVERRGARNQYEGGQRPILPPCMITLVLTAQRITAGDLVDVSINSMSIEAVELPV